MNVSPVETVMPKNSTAGWRYFYLSFTAIILVLGSFVSELNVAGICSYSPTTALVSLGSLMLGIPVYSRDDGWGWGHSFCRPLKLYHIKSGNLTLNLWTHRIEMKCGTLTHKWQFCPKISHLEGNGDKINMAFHQSPGKKYSCILFQLCHLSPTVILMSVQLSNH